MNSDVLNSLFIIFGLTGLVLLLIKPTKNFAYAVLSIAFICLGLAALINNELSALAAFFLALIAARKVKTKFDRK